MKEGIILNIDTKNILNNEPVREIEIDDHTSPSTNEKAGFSFEFGDGESLNTNSRTGSNVPKIADHETLRNVNPAD